LLVAVIVFGKLAIPVLIPTDVLTDRIDLSKEDKKSVQPISRTRREALRVGTEQSAPSRKWERRHTSWDGVVRRF